MNCFRRYVRATVLILAFGILSIAAFAGPMPPCINATISANGNALVINTFTTDGPVDALWGSHVKTSTYSVYVRYRDLNEHLRLNGPNGNFADPVWSVFLPDSDTKFAEACNYTMVTDDGEFLILAQGAMGFGGMTIYRRPSGNHFHAMGVFVRSIPLSELWAPEHIQTSANDHTPEWFAFGTFAFSADNRTLIHKTRWGTTVQIDLGTGKVTGR